MLVPDPLDPTESGPYQSWDSAENLETANVALRACGYRTSTQAGHHVKTIESLQVLIRQY
jgi:hypothetical protein